MKLRNCALLASLTLLSSSLHADPVRIMPMGDSITNGSAFDSPDGTGGYRGPLYNLLTGDGYSVDYIGSLTVNSGLLAEKEHEGHGGWRIDQLDTNVEAWFTQVGNPHIILLHIGTNDFGQGLDTVNAINRYDALLTKIWDLSPDTHVIVTNLMERGEPQNTAIQTEFNPLIQGVVTSQASAGNLVSFLDMRALVPLSDMPDSLHPDQTGYDKMAAGWKTAIDAVWRPGDAVAPAMLRARSGGNGTEVIINFNKAVDQATAENVANYGIDNGVGVLSAVLSDCDRIVTLSTGQQTIGATYTLTVNGVQDQVSPTPNTIAANSTAQFNPATPRGYLNNVPESQCYTLVYSLDLPDSANYAASDPPYGIDYSDGIGEFDRVAYYLELQSASGDLEYAWASMDAFTTDAGEIGVPTLGTGAVFQQLVGNLNVVSNVAGVVNGEDLDGNIEFWPTNYQTTNSLPVIGASGSSYDFGDVPTPGGYGSMQVHNWGAAQTVLAFNRWGGNGGNADVGIGNNPAAASQDWTFAQNAAGFTVKTLQVLVRTLGDTTPPTLVSAEANYPLNGVTVRFSESVRRDTLVASAFALDNGVGILGVSFTDDPREVVLETTYQPGGTALTLTVDSVRDSSQNANEIAPASSISVAAASLPAEVVANIGASATGYELVYTLDIPVTGNLNAANQYSVDDSAVGGGFSRVAYYLELEQAGGAIDYVWASMDAFTADKGMIGVPLLSTGAVFKTNVDNLDVISNVGTLTTGGPVATGNIEFWPNNYGKTNVDLVPSASDTAYDHGDERTTTTAGYGCMQIHDHGAGEVVMALNRFGVDGQTLDVGIGNRAATDTDYTFASNAGAYVRRTLHVMTLPDPPVIPTNVATNVAEDTSAYELVYTLDIPTNGNLSGGNGFQDYTVNASGLSTKSFDRVAYYMELQATGEANPTWVWVSMDAFTNDRGLIGVPSLSSGAIWQQLLTGLTIESNSGNVTTGTGLSGNIEFWPTNYSQANALPVPGANASTFDFGDVRSTTGAYGSMQIHNYVEGETLFAINRWGSTGNTGNALCLGIGNRPGQANSDWTFADNAPNVDLLRRLHVFVRPGPSAFALPQVVSVTGSTTLKRLVVEFSGEVSDGSADPANFSLDGGASVTGATLLADQRSIALTTSTQTAGQLYTVTMSGVRARTGTGETIAPGTTAQFTAYTAPAILANVPDAGMELIYCLDVPVANPAWNLNDIPYLVDEAQYGEILFDRVAYLLELDGDWAYASFDPHTNEIAKTGVPTIGVTGDNTANAFFQTVTNMNVASNVAAVTNGTGIATGNIEFWGENYNGANANGIPNASGTIHDFGDRADQGTYGTLQVHNHGASETILAYNNWGSNTGGSSDVGIGLNPSPPAQGATDWTFMGNAGSYATRNLYVLVHPGGTASGEAPEIRDHPCDREVAAGSDANFSVSVLGDGPFTYQWRCNGVPLAGQTSSWLSLSSVSSSEVASYDVVVTGSNLVSTVSRSGLLTLAGSPPTEIELWRIANGYHPSDGSGAGQGNLDVVAPNNYTNLENFAFGLDKDGQGHAFLPTVIDNTAVDGKFYFEYPRRADFGSAGLSFEEEFNRNLAAGAWEQTPAILPVVQSTTTGFDGVAVQIVREEFPGTLPVSGGKARQARLQTTLNP